MTLRVRPAEAADAPILARLHWQGWEETYRGGLMDDALLDSSTVALRERQWPVWLAQMQGCCLIGEIDDVAVGFASAGPARDPALAADAELNTLYVLRAAHRKGVGRAVLAGCAAWSLAAGHRTLGLWVVDGNDRADAFYTAMGARPTGANKREILRGCVIPEHALRFDDLATVAALAR